MVYAYVLDVPFDDATYQRVLDELGPEPIPGALMHLCVRRSEGGLRYIDVWESEDAFSRALSERFRPALDAVIGGVPDRRPQPLDVLDASGPLLEQAG